MADISDKWSCPRCGALWTRNTQTREHWAGRLRRAQAAHGRDCAKKASTQ